MTPITLAPLEYMPAVGVSNTATAALVRAASPARTACRVCGSTQMLSYLNLGKQPYANVQQRPEGELAPAAPLRVFACQKCQLSQLSYVAPREALYEQYSYRSGVSAGWRAHCAQLAQDYGGADKLTLDIASNDGTLVKAMKATGANAIGVEPSLSFADCEYNRVTRWWGVQAVGEMELAGQVDVITAQNVLGHVHDVHEFMRAIAVALKPNGVAVIEVPYVGDMLRTLSFDTVYHEHLSYWSVTALRELCNAHKLVLRDVQALRVHGGSIRAIVHKGTHVAPSVATYLAREVRDLRKSSYLRFSERVSQRMLALNDTLRGLTPYVGFGAAAKTTVMLHCLDVRAYPKVVYDDNLHKHGFAIPGTRVPILLATDGEFRDLTLPVVVFAWNWAPQIIERLRGAGYRGDIFVPTLEPYWDTVDA
jgi:2-polyprenyl-3-methyl-5-hydroxy-6-metoxy-1,4-benzoquinol methylase